MNPSTDRKINCHEIHFRSGVPDKLSALGVMIGLFLPFT